MTYIFDQRIFDHHLANDFVGYRTKQNYQLHMNRPVEMLVEPTFTVRVVQWFKNIRPICSRTCSRTCSCSRTRTEQEQNFVDFREQEQNENKQYFEHREREQNKNQKNMRVLSSLVLRRVS